MAGNEAPKLNNTPISGNGQSEFDLTRLQDFLLSGETAQSAPAARDLSVEQLEALLAEKRREEARQVHRKLRASQNIPGAQPPIQPAYRDDRPPPNRPAPTPTYRQTPAVRPAPPPESEELRQTRFEPAGLIAHSKRDLAAERSHRLRNIFGYTLEALVIIAALALFGNWLLQQSGISLNLLGATPVADFAVAPSRPGGVFLSANAGGLINLPTTATPAPPIVTPQPGSGPAIVAPTPTPGRVAPLSGPLAVAPTPTPAIVQPVAQSIAQGAEPPPSVPRRLQIPRLGLDTSVKEVTVNLGNWQVADNAAGHHLGTAMPGRAGNMVLAGHRDIRGSIFLRLNEMQKGDEFKVFTDTAVYRYVVTDIYEVAPTEVSVMAPTSDPTATLITCTPIGLATKRLIVKARLEK